MNVTGGMSVKDFFRAEETFSGRTRRERAQQHVGSARERGLVGGREEWEEFTARSCVCSGARRVGGRGGRRRSSSLISPGGSAFTSTSGYLQEHLLVLRKTKVDVSRGEKGPKTSALKHTHLTGNSKILQSVILFSIFFLHKQSNTFQLDCHIYHFQLFLFVCVSGGAAVHTCTRVIHRPEHLCV